MTRATGVGGIFFKSERPQRIYQWYQENLGIERAPDGSGAMFEWLETSDSKAKGMTVWSIFPRDTKYFGAGEAGFMINYRVDSRTNCWGS
jgi:hypothetical protein